MSEKGGQGQGPTSGGSGSGADIWWVCVSAFRVLGFVGLRVCFNFWGLRVCFRGWGQDQGLFHGLVSCAICDVDASFCSGVICGSLMLMHHSVLSSSGVLYVMLVCHVLVCHAGVSCAVCHVLVCHAGVPCWCVMCWCAMCWCVMCRVSCAGVPCWCVKCWCAMLVCHVLCVMCRVSCAGVPCWCVNCWCAMLVCHVLCVMCWCVMLCVMCCVPCAGVYCCQVSMLLAQLSCSRESNEQYAEELQVRVGGLEGAF